MVEVAMKKMLAAMTAIVAVAMLTSCDLLNSGAEGPNELGGNWNIELTEVGQRTTTYFSPPGGYDPAFDNLDVEGVVITNREGVVTYRVTMKFDTTMTLKLDTLLGTSGLPEPAKRAILDTYLERFNATLDTSDKNNMTLTAEIKTKITDKGIQEFFSSGGDESKPFTVVKYDAKVGDEYNMRTFDGRDVKRQVLYRSTTDDYQVGFWYLKVIKVKQTEPNDPLLNELWFVTNHKFGLVGIEATLKDGRTAEMILFPPTL
jgi:hypothetical protein